VERSRASTATSVVAQLSRQPLDVFVSALSRRWIDDVDALERVNKYVELNPEKAGLARSRQEYRFSSAHLRQGQSRATSSLKRSIGNAVTLQSPRTLMHSSRVRLAANCLRCSRPTRRAALRNRIQSAPPKQDVPQRARREIRS